MSKFVARAHSLVARFRKEDSGQDALEYLLTIGVVMILVITAVATGFGPAGIVSDIFTDLDAEITAALGLS